MASVFLIFVGVATGLMVRWWPAYVLGKRNQGLFGLGFAVLVMMIMAIPGLLFDSTDEFAAVAIGGLTSITLGFYKDFQYRSYATHVLEMLCEEQFQSAQTMRQAIDGLGRVIVRLNRHRRHGDTRAIEPFHAVKFPGRDN
jgi:hypothetical protein